MIAFTVNARKIKELEKLLNGNQKKLRKELSIAVNLTAKKTQTLIVKQVGRELATAQKNIKKTVNVVRKASATQQSPSATVRINETKKIPLRDFGARQNKSGVTYRISRGGGRKHIKVAFIVDQYQKNVYVRPGKNRAVGKSKKGVSPWGVFKKKRLKKPTVQDSRVELMLQINRRIRFLKLKQSGAI